MKIGKVGKVGKVGITIRSEGRVTIRSQILTRRVRICDLIVRIRHHSKPERFG